VQVLWPVACRCPLRLGAAVCRCAGHGRGGGRGRGWGRMRDLCAGVGGGWAAGDGGRSGWGGCGVGAGRASAGRAGWGCRGASVRAGAARGRRRTLRAGAVSAAPGRLGRWACGGRCGGGEDRGLRGLCAVGGEVPFPVRESARQRRFRHVWSLLVRCCEECGGCSAAGPRGKGFSGSALRLCNKVSSPADEKAINAVSEQPRPGVPLSVFRLARGEGRLCRRSGRVPAPAVPAGGGRAGGAGAVILQVPAAGCPRERVGAMPGVRRGVGPREGGGRPGRCQGRRRWAARARRGGGQLSSVSGWVAKDAACMVICPFCGRPFCGCVQGPVAAGEPAARLCVFEFSGRGIE
jgi:hypothetical protein